MKFIESTKVAGACRKFFGVTKYAEILQVRVLGESLAQAKRTELVALSFCRVLFCLGIIASSPETSQSRDYRRVDPALSHSR
jgi:hypothetical protein